VNGVVGVGTLGFGRAVLIWVALSPTKVVAVVGPLPCFFSHCGFLYTINEFMALAWMGSGGGVGVLPLSGR
jgi:hypothetical protein